MNTDLIRRYTTLSARLSFEIDRAEKLCRDMRVNADVRVTTPEGRELTYKLEPHNNAFRWEIRVDGERPENKPVAVRMEVARHIPQLVEELRHARDVLLSQLSHDVGLLTNFNDALEREAAVARGEQ